MGNTTSTVLDNIVQGSNCEPLPRSRLLCRTDFAVLELTGMQSTERKLTV